MSIHWLLQTAVESHLTKICYNDYFAGSGVHSFDWVIWRELFTESMLIVTCNVYNHSFTDCTSSKDRRILFHFFLFFIFCYSLRKSNSTQWVCSGLTTALPILRISFFYIGTCFYLCIFCTDNTQVLFLWLGKTFSHGLCMVARTTDTGWGEGIQESVLSIHNLSHFSFEILW